MIEMDLPSFDFDLDLDAGIDLDLDLDLDTGLGLDIDSAPDFDFDLAELDMVAGTEPVPTDMPASYAAMEFMSDEGDTSLPASDLPASGTGPQALDAGPAVESGEITAINEATNEAANEPVNGTGETAPDTAALVNAIGALALPEMVEQQEAPEPIVLFESEWAAPDSAEDPMSPPDSDDSDDGEAMPAAESAPDDMQADLLYAEELIPGQAEAAEARSQEIFSGLVAARGMSTEDTSFIMTETVTDEGVIANNTQFTKTADGLFIIHNERVSAETGSAVSEVLTTRSLESYIDQLGMPARQSTKTLNVGWDPEATDYVMTWHDSNGGNVFPQEVELSLRGRFEKSAWRAIPKPQDPIVLENKYASGPDIKVFHGVKDALSVVADPDYAEAYITSIPDKAP